MNHAKLLSEAFKALERHVCSICLMTKEYCACGFKCTVCGKRPVDCDCPVVDTDDF